MISPKRSGLTALVVAALLASTSTAQAGLTTPACLAKKLKAWGDLRKCQATENGKALQSESADPMKCQTKFNDALAKLNTQATAAAIKCRYRVNGDGTATDYDTGLQWEQKTADGSVHGMNYGYTWNTAYGGTTPNGTAFTAFLGTLNNGTSGDGTATSGCFAGHCDWRLPAIEELAGIRDLSAPGCSTFSPCIDQSVFGPTVFSNAPDGHPSDPYWSATTDSGNPASVWYVDFSNGGVVADGKDDDGRFARGVRSGL